MTKERQFLHFDLIDWDFKSEDSREYLHNFCWYPSRFIPVIPAHLIRALSHEGDTVLDPFCGSGTTILEALKLNRNAVGIDLNPVACFLADTKAKVFRAKDVDIGELVSLRNEIDVQSCGTLFNAVDINRYEAASEIPNYDELYKWYQRDTLHELIYIYQIIKELDKSLLKDLVTVFFISILMSSSGHELKKPYTYYADNVKPKNLIYKNALRNMSTKIGKFICEYSSVTSNDKCTATIINSDIRNLREVLDGYKLVDLIVTSPPYLSVTDYTTGYRLAYLWQLFEQDINETKRKEVGARWQRKSSSAMDNYIGTMKTSLVDMTHVLKSGGYLCMILGESKKYRDEICEKLIDIAENEIGLTLVDSFFRNLSKNFFVSASGGVQTEDIFIFRKREAGE